MARMRSPSGGAAGLAEGDDVVALRLRGVSARRRSWVVLPEPSRPSKVMKKPRGIERVYRSTPRRHLTERVRMHAVKETVARCDGSELPGGPHTTAV